MLFEDLRALVAVVECASLTRAAERLFLTQSAVSRRLQHLEESLGATLFDRSCRPPAPTPMGLRIYESALGVLAAADQLRRIPQEDATPRGTFRVGFTQVVADVVVLDAVTSIRSAFPELEMQVLTNWSSVLHRLLGDAELEVATLLLSAPSSLPPELDGRWITRTEVVVVQSLAHPLIESSTDVPNLARHEWILNPKGCGYRAALESALGRCGLAVKPVIDTHGATMQMRMIAAGLGLGLIPKKLLLESALREQLSIVDVADFDLQMDIWLAWPANPGNLKQAIELLARHLAEGFGQDQTL
jgi:DNA-binding transcriptional LysR family regulator